jgi:hypothetical protein
LPNVTLNPLPVGSNNIGKVDINTLPDIPQFVPMKCTLLAGQTLTIKNNSGYVN